ncbi:peptidase domain-containing ABC transporter [Aquirufa regiilacus]|uniref:Peptidase domain-containing ABC transporter n=1 Tax=Aquirufa regiilacus TaxID=3024868 RepID=A0ABU3TPL5_9BACT|nr:peptidase domain-containing ABC transporter [Aquirufa sp. LEOWEIH-7C]MDU0807805.1 peptidase domain-containing ABC transporter [Aquirufa sp. LEOWEIH-7C]
MTSIKVKQHDIKDCGAACLASIGNHYHLHLPIAKIRQLASTDIRGTNVLGMIQAAEKMGFSAKGVKGGIEALPQIPTPTIAHVILKNQYHHFVVIYKVGKNSIEVMDPAFGKIIKYSMDEFKEIWSGVLIIIAPSAQFKVYSETVSPYKRFWELVQPHKFTLIQSIVGALLYTILGLSMSIYIQKITDHVIADGNRNLLNLLSAGMLLIICLQAFLGSKKSIFMMKSGQLMDAQLILGYYKHLLHLPQRFFDTMRIGEITSRINDAVKIRNFINETAIEVILNLFVVLFSFALMFTYYWKLALIMLLVVPLYLLIYLIMNRLNKKVERRIMEDAAELETQIVESIGQIRTVKEFGLEATMNQKSESRFVKLLFSGIKSGYNSIFASTSTFVLASFFTVILMWAGAGFVLDRQITTGELFSFYALIGFFTGPIASLIGSNKSIQNALIAADRLFEIMDLEREKMENKIDLDRESIGDIVFDQVHFSYGTRVDVFNALSLSIEKGKMTAIVGESGSGKSSLFSIIQGLYPIREGCVKIGEFDLNQINPQSLRRLIVSVPQNTQLFSGNVIENIAIGDPNPDIKRAISLCKELGISEFIEKIPTSYETPLGENGAMLSGGQKQRIAIARALYRDPEILLLDEATSALDTHSEQIIHQVFDKYRMQGKTILVIAHRLSTIMHADHIIVLQAGKIAEQGSHADLVVMKGEYASLIKGTMERVDI